MHDMADEKKGIMIESRGMSGLFLGGNASVLSLASNGSQGVSFLADQLLLHLQYLPPKQALEG